MRCCKNCKWRDTFSAVCCNGKSENRADFVNEGDYCSCWETNIETKNLVDKIKKIHSKKERRIGI